jgi:hypothetical protein
MAEPPSWLTPEVAAFAQPPAGELTSEQRAHALEQLRHATPRERFEAIPRLRRMVETTDQRTALALAVDEATRELGSQHWNGFLSELFPPK